MKIEIRGAEKLSFRERQVVALKEMGKSTEEIAKTLKITASTIATLYNRARNKGYTRRAGMRHPGRQIPGHGYDFLRADDHRGALAG